MRFWQEAAIAASSKFAADENLANVEGESQICLTFLPSRLRMENFLDELNFSDLVKWQERSEGF